MGGLAYPHFTGPEAPCTVTTLVTMVSKRAKVELRWWGDMAGKSEKTNGTAATVGYEAKLWQMADALRGSMDAAEYKHVVLGLIFLKYISDAFEKQHARLEAEKAAGADPEDPDEYRAINIFWVPPEARWSNLRNRAKDPKIGKIVDDAMLA